MFLVVFVIGVALTSGRWQFEFYTDVAFCLWLFVVGSFSSYRWIRDGRAVEGLITSVSDDGVDLLCTVYCEVDKQTLELQIIEKLKSHPRRLQPGDVVTLFLGEGFGTPPCIVLFPRIPQTPIN